MKNRIKPVVNQYYSEKQYSLYIPLYILLSVLLVSIITTLFIGINEGLPLTKENQLEFAQNNTAPIFSFPAFLVVAGALCVNRQFSAALAFGSTRKNFWIGTLVGFLGTAAVTGIFSVIMLAIEKITNHWWLGVHAFDVYVLGNGNPWITFAVIFSLSLVSLLIGATYGTIFRSWGTKGLVLRLTGTGIIILSITALYIWKAENINTHLASGGIWILVAVASTLSLVYILIGSLANRKATF